MSLLSSDIISTVKSSFSVAASLAAYSVLLPSTLDGLIPYGVVRRFQKLMNRFSPQQTIILEEFHGLEANEIFGSANTYIGSKLTSSAQKIKVHKPSKEDHFSLSMDKNQEFYDSFKGVTFKWVMMSKDEDTPVSNTMRGRDKHETRQLELSFHKKHKDMVLSSYLPYILQKANDIRAEKTTLKLHTIGGNNWNSISLNHPATFDSIAMDLEMKKGLLEDLHLFTERKEYYKRAGRAWKRGYLLYGPPGTGKSSLIAAMANHLKFDIYDLDLRAVYGDSDLRRLLTSTTSRSIIVMEDIDCSIELQNRETTEDKDSEGEDDDKVSLSGLLNFMDGLWTSCAEERIVICTTNYKDRLDPALLRPGRMDVHVHLSYCSFGGFKILAANYLQIEEHPLFEDIKELLQKVEATPAEVAGELMKSADVDIALKNVINFLHRKITDSLV